VRDEQIVTQWWLLAYQKLIVGAPPASHRPKSPSTMNRSVLIVRTTSVIFTATAPFRLATCPPHDKQERLTVVLIQLFFLYQSVSFILY
jgi:hypothetical protein